jgi:hypothetical protein
LCLFILRNSIHMKIMPEFDDKPIRLFTHQEAIHIDSIFHDRQKVTRWFLEFDTEGKYDLLPMYLYYLIQHIQNETKMSIYNVVKEMVMEGIPEDE